MQFSLQDPSSCPFSLSRGVLILDIEKMEKIEVVDEAVGKLTLSDGEDDAVDYTNSRYRDSENLYNVRISNGISIRDLHSNGVVFSPEIDNNANYEETQRNYYTNHTEELESILKSAGERVTIIEEAEYLNDFESVRRLMTNVTGDGGVMKRVIKEGIQTAGSVPDNGTIKIHYSMHLEGQDEPYDSSILRGKPEKYKIGEGQLLIGLERGILTMKKKEKAQLLIDCNYAFGQLGCPPRIPAEAQLLANVELLDFVEDGKAESMLSVPSEERGKQFSFDEIMKAVDVEHKCGNNAVRNLEWKIASRHYERGTKLLQETSLANQVQEDRSRKLLLKLYLNAAHCYIKLQWPRKACTACKEALEIEENTKALYRFGKAKRMLEDLEGARALLIRAQRKAPQDMNIADELRSLEDQVVRDREKEKLLCTNMFGKIKSERKEKVEQGLFNMIYSELQLFKDQPEKEMSLSKDQFSTFQQWKALSLAASELGLSVTEIAGAGGPIKVSKP